MNKLLGRLLFCILMFFGTWTALAQNSVLKKCTYEGPELSFGFLYPSFMQEIPTVRPHVKKRVVELGKFGFFVGLVDMSSIIPEFEREFQLPIDSLVEDDDVLLWMLFGNSDYKAQGFQVKGIQRGYVIDRLPAILVILNAEGQRLDQKITGTQFYFVMFYGSVMINLTGTIASDNPLMDAYLERFKAIASTFAVTSQYL